MKPDIMVYDRNDRLVLVVEVKATKNGNPDWAAKLRRNLIANHLLPEARFFLLVLPEHTYLWKDATATQEVAPNFAASTGHLLRPYLPALAEGTSRLSESGLEMAVRSWLNEITSPTAGKRATADEERLLDQSGLASQLSHASLVYGDAA